MTTASTSDQLPHVVVVGAGFGGLAVARELANDPVEVTVVDQHNYNTFQPLLYQVATAGLDASDVAHAVRGIFQEWNRVTFRHGTVAGLEPDQGQLLLDGGQRLAYDHLVLAAGATTNYFGVSGAAEHAMPLYALDDATALRSHVLARFEAADADPSLVEDGALTFVVVGGGPTGVEVAGALSELFGAVLARDFPRLAVNRARVVLVEMADDLLGTLSRPLRDHARTTLERRSVEVMTGAAVEHVGETEVRLAGAGEPADRTIPAHTVIWAAGVRPHPLAEATGLATGPGGRIAVRGDLSVTGHPEISAIGDIAAVPGPRGVLPQLAPVAMQAGGHAARQIRRRLAGESTRRFRYRDKGTMATIGRRAAVAELPLGIRLWGTPAWLAWLGLHLVFIIGFRNRMMVLANWAWNYITWDRGPRLILQRPIDDDPDGAAG